MDYDNDFKEDELNPLEVNSQDIEDILDQLSFNTVRANIEDQISGELEPNRNFLGILTSKVNTIMASLSDTEMRRQITDEYATFCTDLSRLIIEKYNLACSLLTDIDMADDLLENIYGFFVQNQYLYAKQFFCNYIKQNKDAIISALGLSMDTGDITTLANRKKESNDAIVLLVSNIDQVIDYVMYSAQITPTELLDTIDDGDIYISALIEYYDTYQITGNFVTQFLEEVADDSCSDRSLEIRNDIRVNLYLYAD
ncbi:MAG: hypothetical protein NC548_27795 [Lachnospiraceae bacterium]|nr:hypothetical protein [Lachnospiraceae bacterium]